MPRLDMLKDDDMSADQANVCAETISGLRGTIPPNLIPWLRSPEMARRAQILGEFCRYRSIIGQRLTELAILVCARHWTSHTEWRVHKPIALAEGLEPHIVEAIAARRLPEFSDAATRLVYEVSSTLLSSGRVPDGLYKAGLAELGEQGMVELVGILGYYCLVALTLNAFEIGLPEQPVAELGDPAYAMEG